MTKSTKKHKKIKLRRPTLKHLAVLAEKWGATFSPKELKEIKTYSNR